MTITLAAQLRHAGNALLDAVEALEALEELLYPKTLDEPIAGRSDVEQGSPPPEVKRG